jgi:hypothetical protein
MTEYEKWGFSAIAHSTGITTTTSASGSYNFGTSFSPQPVAISPRPETIPPVTKTFPLVVDLPEVHLLWIGKIIVQWSMQEWLLQHILFPLVTDNEAIARLTLGTPRSKDAVERIEQICKAKGVSLKTDFAKLKTELMRLEKLRDQIGHGAWVLDDFGRYYAVVYSGNWGAGELQGTSNRITPHAMPIDETFLSKTVEDIKATIELTKILAKETGVAK